MSGPATQPPERTAYFFAACVAFGCSPCCSDAEVGRAEMLARAVLDRPLAVLDRRILLADAGDAGEGRGLLLMAVDQVVVVPVAQRHIVVADR